MTGLLTRERDALLAAIRRATLAMKAATAEGRFELAMARLGRLLHERRLERRYNPNWPSQPRVPRGNLDGGQWTDGGASPGGEELEPSEFEETVAGDFPPNQYVVDLIEEEIKGGHTIAVHVGRTPQSLLARVRGGYYSGPLYTVAIRRDGSFSSVVAANKLVNSTIAQNRHIVDRVASGEIAKILITATFRSRTGVEAYRPSPNADPRLRDTNGVGVIIVHDPENPKGYRVHTAYPRND